MKPDSRKFSWNRWHPDGGRWRVSSEGGISPAGRQTGNRLYYMTPGGDLLATEISMIHGRGPVRPDHHRSPRGWKWATPGQLC